MVYPTNNPSADWDQHCKEYPDIPDETPIDLDLIDFEPEGDFYLIENGCIVKRRMTTENGRFYHDSHGRCYADYHLARTEEEAYKLAQKMAAYLNFSVAQKLITDETQTTNTKETDGQDN